MNRNVCCVPECRVGIQDGVPLHYFPCPVKDAERFKNWVKVIGGDIASLDSTTISKTRRICRQHFRKEFLYPKNRLCKLAVPSLLLPSVEVSAPCTVPEMSESSSSQETHHDITQPRTTGLVEYFKAFRPAPNIVPEICYSESSSSQETIVHCDVTQPSTTRAVKYFKAFSSEPFLKRKHEENKVKKLEQKLREVLKVNQTLRKKYLLAKKIRKTNTFEIVTKRMASAAKSLFYSQVNFFVAPSLLRIASTYDASSSHADSCRVDRSVHAASNSLLYGVGPSCWCSTF